MPPPIDPPKIGAMISAVSQPPRGPEDRGLATAQEVGNQARAEVAHHAKRARNAARRSKIVFIGRSQSPVNSRCQLSQASLLLTAIFSSDISYIVELR